MPAPPIDDATMAEMRRILQKVSVRLRLTDAELAFLRSMRIDVLEELTRPEQPA